MDKEGELRAKNGIEAKKLPGKHDGARVGHQTRVEWGGGFLVFLFSFLFGAPCNAEFRRSNVGIVKWGHAGTCRCNEAPAAP